jgi:hypothetical protein
LNRNPNSKTGLRKFGALLPVLGLLGVILSAPRNARASSGKHFLETIGISVAVGTVLGASTLPFYDQPGSHLANLAYGASLGAVAGVGLLIHGLFDGSSQREGFPEEYSEIKSGNARIVASLEEESARTTSIPSTSLSSFPSRPASAFWLPVVSLTW